MALPVFRRLRAAKLNQSRLLLIDRRLARLGTRRTAAEREAYRQIHKTLARGK